jgi:hypothetical protein
MAVRIRQDGTILCAAAHPARATDTYLDDGLHYKLAVELGALVTEPIEPDPSNPGRGGHAAHGEWWWRDDVPSDAVVS